MNYNEALAYIHDTKRFGSKLGLENIKALLELLENPQDSLRFIHIAGTNGKGSTATYISNVLRAGRYNVGLFTSPYLEEFTERIRINGLCIPKEELARITFLVKGKVETMVEQGYNHPTEFEIVTAIALKYYEEMAVDFVVLEVGLGGRYDSTNVIGAPIAAVMTPISMDHMEILGDTIEKIAWEKAGIIKKNNLVIMHPQLKGAENVIKEVIKDKNGELISVPLNQVEVLNYTNHGSNFDFKFKDHKLENLEIQLIGRHQIYNAATALTTLLILRERKIIGITDDEIKEGLKTTKWRGRLEVLGEEPAFIIDGAHNHQGAQTLKNSILELFHYEKLILGISVMEDKDADNMIKELAPLADQIIVTEAKIPRAMKGERLSDIIQKYNSNILVEKDLERAVKRSYELANQQDLIVFAGSLYLIGDVRKIINK